MNWTYEHKETLKRLAVEAEDAIGTTAALPYTMQILEALQNLERWELQCRAQ